MARMMHLRAASDESVNERPDILRFSSCGVCERPYCVIGAIVVYWVKAGAYGCVCMDRPYGTLKGMGVQAW